MIHYIVSTQYADLDLCDFDELIVIILPVEKRFFAKNLWRKV